MIVDYYSRYPEVIKVSSTSTRDSTSVKIYLCETHGIPEIIITGSEPPFTSQDFANFTNELEIEHKTSSPGYPKANGLVKRMTNAKTNNGWRPATIIREANQSRSYIIRNNDGRMLKRNRVRPRSYPVGQRRSSESLPQLDPTPSTSSESSGQKETA
ncbi:K02A2.6-like [Cordylochernes scorpioides]|uniref:K02A2.6-like n=1 Tax=Cordylochernes scorpioides TaxID=51811 RepID=A0ABY6LTZ3_9ARAC|nr:K02A2.6-like [Cordylochernes scorpioides]